MHIESVEANKELLIKPDNSRSLQEQVDDALKEGFQVLRLEGYFWVL